MRLIDADKLYVDICSTTAMPFLISCMTDRQKVVTDMLNTINNAPTVDAVPVVRCKDCKYWNRDTAWCDIHSHFTDREGQFCYPEESGDWLMFDENYFCAEGKRNEETKNTEETD